VFVSLFLALIKAAGGNIAAGGASPFLWLVRALDSQRVSVARLRAAKHAPAAAL
jgi:hypothetical protein